MPAGFPFSASVLAPLEGLTTPDLRDLIASYGPVGLVCTEFVRVFQRPGQKRLRDVVRRSASAALSVQLMGNDPEWMAEATRRLASAGADVVDINLGCPTRRAIRGNVGAGLLRDPDLLRRVLDAMRRSTSGILSAKIRAGFDDAQTTFALARTVEAAGVDFVTVHPRRGVDLYSGVADWRLVAALKQTLSIPVVGNGDLWYAADALRLQRESGCDAVMIGRPAIRNPWIFRQLSELRRGVEPFRPAGVDLVAHVERLAESLARALAPERHPGALKEHLCYLSRALPRGGELRQRVLPLETIEAILAAWRREIVRLSASELDLTAAPQQALERVPRLDLPSAPSAP